MGNLWIYIRTLFEEYYAKKENSFECVEISVKRGNSQCICIPGAAINYIANEMKFCTKKPGYSNTWAMKWNPEEKVYCVLKSSTDWNAGIPDLQTEGSGNFYDTDAQFCTAAPNGYTYIKIRNYQDIMSSTVNPKKLYEELEGEISQKIRLEFFIILAREFRTEMSINNYIKMLFRFSFFLHPYSGIKVLEQNCDEQSCRNFNISLLTEYCQMVKQLEKQEISPLDRINAVGKFIGADIAMLYEIINDLRTQADIRGINDFFQEQANITKKVSKDSRLKNVMKIYGVVYS